MTITGAGTETDPYLVSTAEELRECLESDSSGAYPGIYIQLANDIDKVGDKLTSTNITTSKTSNVSLNILLKLILILSSFFLFASRFANDNISLINVDILLAWESI